MALVVQGWLHPVNIALPLTFRHEIILVDVIPKARHEHQLVFE
jgi:hypothetical protein